MSDEWEDIESFEDQALAEALAEFLRNNGVPAKVETSEPIPGLIENVRVKVPASLSHRARWLRKSNRVTDAELEFIATGKLGESN